MDLSIKICGVCLSTIAHQQKVRAREEHLPAIAVRAVLTSKPPALGPAIEILGQPYDSTLSVRGAFLDVRLLKKFARRMLNHVGTRPRHVPTTNYTSVVLHVQSLARTLQQTAILSRTDVSPTRRSFSKLKRRLYSTDIYYHMHAA